MMNATRKSLLIALIVVVDVLAAASIMQLPREGLFDRPLTLLVLFALATFAGSRSIMIPRLGLKLVPADIFVLCALLALAPAAAPIVALGSMIGTALSKGSRLLSIQTAFNSGAVPLSMAVATGAFLALGGNSGQDTPAILPVLAAAIVYALINVPLTATAVSLGTGRNWFELFRNPFGLAIVSNITSALLGASLMLLYVAVGPLGFALGLVPLIPMEQYLLSHARRDDAGSGDTKTVPQSPANVKEDSKKPAEMVARTAA
jgi:hypothetical protein